MRDFAKQLGEDIPETSAANAVQSVVANLSLSHAFDILEAMKTFADENRAGARSLLEAKPQLVFALIEIQVCMHIQICYTCY